MGKRIYLAGKIGKNDWRHELIKELRDEDGIDYWPILPEAIMDRFDYVGPYFIGCDHGCCHGPGSHGVGIGADPTHGGCATSGYFTPKVRDVFTKEDTLRSEVAARCMEAIKRSDLVYAWLDTADAYGTIFELGFAKALQGTGQDIAIALAGPAEFTRPQSIGELWFPFTATALTPRNGGHSMRLSASSPIEGLRQTLQALGWLFDSPMEYDFWTKWMELAPEIALECQYEVLGGKYRLDFACIEKKIALELDGYTYHSDKPQFKRDRKRDRELSREGWRVLRFASEEVFGNVEKCVKEAAKFISST